MKFLAINVLMYRIRTILTVKWTELVDASEEVVIMNANRAIVTFVLAGSTAVVQHVGRVLAAIAKVCPVNAPVAPV